METKHKKCPRCHSHAGGVVYNEKRKKEMKQPKISVIIPVYNGGKTIGKAIKSVLKQTYTNYELLIIDDGSTDNSLDICQSFARKDPRIRVVHKQNEGIMRT